jgi:anaerobic magnesium-protoporphyrin IX monomethyl ester cyclase
MQQMESASDDSCQPLMNRKGKQMFGQQDQSDLGEVMKARRQDRLILLVTSPYVSHQRPGTGSFFPLGIVLVASILKDAGYRVKIIDGATDAAYYERVLEIVRQEHPLFVGFSVMTSQVAPAYALTKEIKSLAPGLPIVWGGFHPTIYPEQTIKDPLIDVIVAGEGVHVVVPLADCLLLRGDLGAVPGIYFRRDGTLKATARPPLAQFADIPDIDWSLYDQTILEHLINRINDLGQKVRVLPLLTGLGCNFHCSFCFNTIFKLRHRTMDAERIIANMKRLKEQYQIDELTFYDENFFGNRGRFFRFLELLEKEPLNIQFFASMRASDVRKNYLHEEILKRLFRVGGYNFGVGAESGSQRILHKIKKGITPDDIRKLAHLSLSTGIVFTFSFMTGLPGEQIAEMFETLDLIREIKSINPRLIIIGPQIFRPYPGSELFYEAVKAGLQEPNSLQGWTKSNFMMNFRQVNPGSLPWIANLPLFSRIIIAYNIQSSKWMLYDNRFLRLPKWLSRLLVQALNKSMTYVVQLSKWRLVKRNMKYMLELPLLIFLNHYYLKEV